MLNDRLAKDRGITNCGKEAINDLQHLVDNVVEHPELYGDNQDVLAILESLEYSLQALWKFTRNKNYHRASFKLKKCECPAMDNKELLGTPYRSYSTMCPYHGINLKQKEQV